jgi:hypothetical protein
VVIRVGSLLVVVEAKYWSGFGSYGGQHQLTAEWIRGRRLADVQGMDGPVVVAVTSDLVEPDSIDSARLELARLVPEVSDLPPDGAIKWTPWQTVAEVIERADKGDWSSGDHALVSDLFALLTRRRVRFMFEGIRQADWWSIAAAADAAAERVYPAVAEFAQEVVAHGAARGLIWGGNDAGVVWYESKQLGASTGWHRNYVQLPMLHETFGKRIGNWFALYSLFTFNRPGIHTGFWFQLKRGKLDDRQAAAIATWLRALPLELEVLESTSWQFKGQPVDRSAIDAGWVSRVLAGRGARGGWLRVDRAWDVEYVTSTTPVVDALDDLAQSLLADGSVLDALASNDSLDRAAAAATPASPRLVASEAEDGPAENREA